MSIHLFADSAEDQTAVSALESATGPRVEPLEGRFLLSAAHHVAAHHLSPHAAGIPRYDHVVVVVEENQNYDQILGRSAWPPTAFPSFEWPNVEPMPVLSALYLRHLAQHSAVFTQSHAITHPSQPNYLELFSGSDQGITSDAPPGRTFTAPNLGGELLAAGDSFAGYSESLPHAGYQGDDVGNYARRHAPWVNFADVPAEDNLPFSAFPHHFSKLPTISFVIPNLVHDMHSGSIQKGDRWLKKHLNRYAHWAAKHNSLLIVTFDENNGDGGNQIATLFSGAHINPGSYDERITHDNVLRTLEDMYDLTPTGNAATATPITDVFSG